MNFLGLDSEFGDYKKSRFVVLPIPYERTTSFGTGTEFGPKKIINASHYVELYDEETDSTPAESGVSTLDSLPDLDDPAEMDGLIAGTVSKIFNDAKIPIILGGEHSISYGAVKSAKKTYPNLTVLHFDAHLDLRETYEGTIHSHACVMSRISHIAPVVSVGIRSLSWEESVIAKKMKEENRLFYASEILDSDKSDEILSSLTNDVYISFDVDSFDPSIMPSTGTPEPGGLNWYVVLNILRKVAEKRNIIGVDIVELSPIDTLNHPEFTCAKLVYKIISFIDSKKT